MIEIEGQKRTTLPKWGIIAISVGISFLLTLLAIEDSSPSSTKDYGQEINNIKSDISLLNSNAEWTRMDINNLKFPSGTVELSPASKDYAISKTQHGVLYFALDDIKKYADGHKIILNVGNPTATRFSDAALKIRYNSNPANAKSWEEWNDSIKTTSFTMKGDLVPATWSPFEIVLSPSTEEETGWIEITPILNNVIMTTVPLRK